METKRHRKLPTTLQTVKVALLAPLFICFAGPVWSASTDWIEKQAADWTEADAVAILSSSAWVKSVRVPLPPELTPQQRREGGAVGGTKGIGLAGLQADLLHGIREKPDVRSGSGSIRVETIEIRWESALPVRVAEIKAGEAGAPEWEGDYYVISIRNLEAVGGTLPKAASLQRFAYLQSRDGNLNAPIRVAVVPQSSAQYTVLYFFSRRTGIRSADKEVLFSARIGSIALNERFDLTRMRYLKQLEL